MENEELLPHAEACVTREQQIDFIVLNIARRTPIIRLLICPSPKHQVENYVLFFHLIVAHISYYKFVVQDVLTYLTLFISSVLNITFQ